ncbi:hypothetical protein [Nostoc parmelioides]|uniref:Uncharacterized protein n=1 Tax=Nostoc parmelioides FACHB-3921 TaxID=2692909 RepID=A0ABR8BM83_9NOSO|nr:hypothetical protein [Nostoc parmelioides]MBD2254779.1 hypothetical protein [Nostoc parmelioides FACHB-3921]
MKKLEIATGLAQYKVLLAILGVVGAGLSFEMWKWNQQQHEKYIAEKEQACQQSIEDASNEVLSNRFLKSNYYAGLMLQQSKFRLNQPGINTKFKADKDYILMYSQPASLIPNNPRYEGSLFERLSKVTNKQPPAPIIVTGKKLSGNKVEVISACAPKSFTVSLENLYEITQPIDISPYLPPFSSFD